MTAQRNQLQAEVEEMQESMKKQMALRDADEEKQSLVGPFDSKDQ